MKRFAIVIEKAQGNYAGYVPICQAASQQVRPLKKRSCYYERRSSCTSKECARTALRFQNRQAWWNI